MCSFLQLWSTFFSLFFYILYSTHLALSQLMQTATNLSFNVLCIVISNPPSWHHYYPYWLQSKTRPCSLHQFCNHELSMEFTPILRSWVVYQIHTDSVCCPWNSHPFSMLGCPRNSHWLCMLSCPWNSHHELPIEFQCTIQWYMHEPIFNSTRISCWFQICTLMVLTMMFGNSFRMKLQASCQGWKNSRYVNMHYKHSEYV